MTSPSATTIEIHDRKTTVQFEPVGLSPTGRWQKKTAGMFSGQRSSGGILVVDDDPNVRKVVRLMLEHEGYDVLEAQDGEEASTLLRSGENPMLVDTIITDLSMQKMSGGEAIAFFKREFPSIPVIILTGTVNLKNAVSFMKQGISDYLVKPVSAKQLLASVARAISHRQLPGG